MVLFVVDLFYYIPPLFVGVLCWSLFWFEIFWVLSSFAFILMMNREFKPVYLFVFVALRPMSTAMVIAGRSVHLTTLFLGQA